MNRAGDLSEQIFQQLSAFLDWTPSDVLAVEPEQVKGHVVVFHPGGHQLLKARHSLGIERDDFPIDHRFGDSELCDCSSHIWKSWRQVQLVSGLKCQAASREPSKAAIAVVFYVEPVVVLFQWRLGKDGQHRRPNSLHKPFRSRSRSVLGPTLPDGAHAPT